MIVESKFKPLWYMSNPHIQTIYSSLRRPIPPRVDKLERLELPDGDFLTLAWSSHELPAYAPLVIIFHGLAGCLNSSYVGRFMHAFHRFGWRAVLMQFRGAGGEANRLPRIYHSGDTSDLDYFTQILQEREPNTPKAIVGVSLGGNVLLKWLGENPEQDRVSAGVAVSVPYVLSNAANRVNYGFSKVYQTRLLNQIKPLFTRKLALQVDPPEPLKRAENCSCFWTFDNEVTAPLNGFQSVHDYYRQSSSRQFLKNINIPTLLIHAKDDPFMTPDVLPADEELSKHILLEISEKGGHVGFISAGKMGKPMFWLDQRIPEYLAEHFRHA